MEIKEILDACIATYADCLDRGTTAELFRAMYPYPFDDFEEIVANIQLLDEHTKRKLVRDIEHSLMDLMEIPETQATAFMFRLRLENAICTLTILAQAKVSCTVQTGFVEEALVWALTTLWTPSCAQWACRTARAFCDGKPSAMPWPLPE